MHLISQGWPDNLSLVLLKATLVPFYFSELQIVFYLRNVVHVHISPQFEKASSAYVCGNPDYLNLPCNSHIMRAKHPSGKAQ